MTLDDAPAPTRRALRARTLGMSDAGSQPEPRDPLDALLGFGPETAQTPVQAPLPSPRRPPADATFQTSYEAGPGPRRASADAPRDRSVVTGPPAPRISADESHPKSDPGRRVAFAWVDEASIARRVAPLTDFSTAAIPFVPVETDLLADAPRRSPLRASVIVPTVITAAVIGAYAATTLLWPLHAVAPTVSAIQALPVAAPATTPVWPAVGSAAISVAGAGGTVASAPAPDEMASITKVVTALAVLDKMPLALGEQGPSYRFSGSDRNAYWGYRWRGESALDVPVGGSLTEYQLLEGMLIGSANNYADRLANILWPSDAVYAQAANEWLRAHGVPDITVVEPTGMDTRNTATPAALITLAEKALAHPVIAEIVAKPATDLPGAGHVVNTNGLLADPGVLGIKTGTLDEWNLLSAKQINVGETPVRLYASVLGQPDDAARLAASRALYAQLEAELQPRPSVAAGTTVGIVETAWGESVDIVTTADASVILWNGGVGAVSTTYSLDDSREEGDIVGSLSVDGPLDDAAVDIRLAGDIEDPSAWWRLTHPLELFGLID